MFVFVWGDRDVTDLGFGLSDIPVSNDGDDETMTMMFKKASLFHMSNPQSGETTHAWRA